MRWYAIWVLAISMSSCKSDFRKLEMCLIDFKAGVADCATYNKKRQLPLEHLDGYFAISEADFMKIAEKLEFDEVESETNKGKK